MRRKRTSRWPSRSPKRFPARMATTSTAGTWYVHLRHVPCRHVAPTHPTCPGAPQALARPGNINSGPVIVHQSGRSALHDIVRKCNSRSANLAQNEYYGRFLGSKHHAMRQRHAISPGFSVHYQDPELLSYRRDDSTYNFILSVERHPWVRLPPRYRLTANRAHCIPRYRLTSWLRSQWRPTSRCTSRSTS